MVCVCTQVTSAYTRFSPKGPFRVGKEIWLKKISGWVPSQHVTVTHIHGHCTNRVDISEGRCQHRNKGIPKEAGSLGDKIQHPSPQSRHLPLTEGRGLVCTGRLWWSPFHQSPPRPWSGYVPPCAWPSRRAETWGNRINTHSRGHSEYKHSAKVALSLHSVCQGNTHSKVCVCVCVCVCVHR